MDCQLKYINPNTLMLVVLIAVVYPQCLLGTINLCMLKVLVAGYFSGSRKIFFSMEGLQFF